MLEIDKVYSGDCLELMKEMPDKCVDLIFTDPPYGIGESGLKNHSRGKLAQTTKFIDYGWDKEIVAKEYFDEIFRISKNQIIFGGNFYVEYLYNSPCWIVWDKDNNSNDFADCELAWSSFKTAVRKFTWRWNGVLQQDMKNKEQRYHPTQKPVGLFMKILEMYSKEGDLVCDPFGGSGTTAIACINTNRHFIVIEKERDYVGISNKCIEQAKIDKAERDRQIEMF